MRVFRTDNESRTEAGEAVIFLAGCIAVLAVLLWPAPQCVRMVDAADGYFIPRCVETKGPSLPLWDARRVAPKDQDKP
jgi:hypothetical protein